MNQHSVNQLPETAAVQIKNKVGIIFPNLAVHNRMNSLSLYTKLETLPQELKQEVSDFIDFLIKKQAAARQKLVPQFGSAKGKIEMAPDFDAPLDDFKEYM